MRRWQFDSKVKKFAIPSLVALFPIVLTLRIVRGNWTSVPNGDEWWTPGGQIVSFLRGTLRFAELFQQHNESRKLFPNLYYLFLVWVTGRWDVKDAMVLMFVGACVGSFLLYVLLQQTTTFKLPDHLWAWAFLNIVFFCPALYENFLFGIQLEPLTPGVALLAALTINLSRLQFGSKILANSALAFLATYSYANGMLLWVLGTPIYHNSAINSTKKSIWNSRVWLVFYAFIAALSLFFYFHHYVKPAQTPTFATSLNDALPLLRFLLAWVGNLFVVSGANPLFLGSFFVGLIIALTIAAIRDARRQRTFRRFYPWVVIAAYALASGVVIASGRMRSGGIGTALVWRYAPVSIFFYVGLAGLAASLYNAWVTGGYPIRPRLVFASGLTIGLLTAGWLSSFTTQLARVKVVRENRKDVALAVSWIPAIRDNPDLNLGSLAEVPLKIIVERAIALSKYDVLRPRLIAPSLVSIVQEDPPDRDPSVGMLRSARFSDDHRLLLTGIAWLPYRYARADCVVVGYTNSDGRLTPFTVFQPTYMRQRLKGRFDFKRLPTNGFAAVIDSANLPMGELTLRAWAVDLRAERALPMAGALTVDNEPVETK